MPFTKKQSLNIIGVMSGSSMDGIDIALCKFSPKKQTIEYTIINAITIPYPPSIHSILNNIRNTSAKDFFQHDVTYGQWIGKTIKKWTTRHHLKADAIAFHGHTVFHHPEKGFSIQLGNATQIAAITGIPVVHNFRNADIALGGQGAPLVPIGDKLLFHQYDACINIGGIANVFIQKTNVAFDICIANMAINYYAQYLHKKYDKNGHIAASGNVSPSLLNELNHLKHLKQKPPKSLNREYFENHYLPLIRKYQMPVHDIISTITEHIATQIAQSISEKYIKNVLITGGGAFNTYLIKRIFFYAKDKKIHIPDKTIVKFKEALIFALLGYLRINDEYGNIKEATGASKNTFCGEIVKV